MRRSGLERPLYGCKRTFFPTGSTRDSHASVVHVHSALENGCIDYVRGWAWQNVLLNRRLLLRRVQDQDETILDSDIVLMLEHKPVYTLGRGSDEKNLICMKNQEEARNRLSRSCRGIGSARLTVDSTLIADEIQNGKSDVAVIEKLCSLSEPVVAPNGVPIYRVERGGEVTFHGPGQLVVYPLFDLQREPFEKDLHWYLRMVEEVIINTLGRYDIDATRDDINTGVWVGKEKVAAVGVASSRWITTHGFALNVCPDISYFDTSNIVPCGIEERGVTSMQKIMTQRGETSPSISEVASVVLEEVRHCFSVPLEVASAIT